MEAAAERTKRKAAQNTPLVRALGLAHYWQRLLDEAKFRSITDIATVEGFDVTQARRLLRLTLLAPAVVEQLLANPDATINLESGAAPGDATGLAGAGRGVCAGVIARDSIYRPRRSAGVVAGAAVAGGIGVVTVE